MAQRDGFGQRQQRQGRDLSLPFRPVIRPVRSSDQGFVAKGFVKQLVSRGIGNTEANTLVDFVLDSKLVKILIAADPNNTDRIAGWMIYVPRFPGRRVIVYVYTRDQYREQGVARALFNAAFPSGGGKLMHTFAGPDSGTLLQKFPSQYIAIDELLGVEAA